ncbi:MAG: hypothetical protein J6D57_09155 [Mogibacterium sp.]|nr:hypothetical protein [Mogibacterium sp.]
MITKEELKEMISEINSRIDEQYGISAPKVDLYSVPDDGLNGVDHICSLSLRRRAIVINHDELCRMYPYMDKNSMKKLLASIVFRTIKELV